MTPSSTEWKLFSDDTTLTEASVGIILQTAQEAIAQRGRFLIVLAGGNTPRMVYQALAKEVTDWANWHVYFNDERCLPAQHLERNSLMALDSWLKKVAIPPQNIHIIPAERGAHQAAIDYANTLREVGYFDLVLLGLGEDGHTASLFPNHTVDNSADAIAIFNAPKPPPERVTLSPKRLNRSRQALFLVTGNAKQAAINDWRRGVNIPATLIQPAHAVMVYCSGVVLN